MKKLLMVAITLIASVSVFAQDNGTSAEWGYVPSKDTTTSKAKDKFNDTTKTLKYEDVFSNLYVSKIILKPLSQKQLKDHFENWAALTFVSYNTVNQGETDNQIVIKYKKELIVETTYKSGEKKVKTQVGVKKNGKPKYKKILQPIYRQSHVTKTFDITLVAQFKDGKTKILVYDKTGVYNEYVKKWENSILFTIESFESSFNDKSLNMNW